MSGGDGCPEPEVLEAFAANTLYSEEKARVEEHCDLCVDCQVMVDFLKIQSRQAVSTH